MGTEKHSEWALKSCSLLHSALALGSFRGWSSCLSPLLCWADLVGNVARRGRASLVLRRWGQDFKAAIGYSPSHHSAGRGSLVHVFKSPEQMWGP